MNQVVQLLISLLDVHNHSTASVVSIIMKFTSSLALGLLAVPEAMAWGGKHSISFSLLLTVVPCLHSLTPAQASDTSPSPT